MQLELLLLKQIKSCLIWNELLFFRKSGFLYGGSSSIKEVELPFNNVLDNILEINNVKIIPSKIANTTAKVEIILDLNPVYAPAIKIVDIAIKKGYLPLHGTNEFVIAEIILSCGVSIILVPTTPAALQPKPIHIVIICFPLVMALLKKPSILNASLGRKPKSSKKVKSGKNIAIGGSITEIIQLTV